MGYCVDIELRNVKFKQKDQEKVKEVLFSLNEKWKKGNDWCRFYADKTTDILDIFEEIGFESVYNGEYVHIQDFLREKLGDHENIFECLAPWLENCEIVYRGEDYRCWKQVINNNKIETVYQEEL